MQHHKGRFYFHFINKLAHKEYEFSNSTKYVPIINMNKMCSYSGQQQYEIACSRPHGDTYHSLNFMLFLCFQDAANTKHWKGPNHVTGPGKMPKCLDSLHALLRTEKIEANNLAPVIFIFMSKNIKHT